MAEISKSSVKFSYVVGMEGEKEVTRSKSYAYVTPTLTDELATQFGQLLLAVCEYPGEIQRVDTKILA